VPGGPVAEGGEHFMAARQAVAVSWFDTGITVVKLVGEHDLSGKDELAERLQEPVLAGGLAIVDLSETEFLDCSVLTTLLEVDRLARTRGLRVTLQLKPDSGVARVLDLAGLTTRLLWAESRQEAASLARAGSHVSSSSEDGAPTG
jgi:anti-anti-sigma factor